MNATKDLKPFKAATLGDYEFTSILSKGLVAALSAEIGITDELTWTQKLGIGNPITYVQGFLNDYMYTVLTFKKIYSTSDYQSFWKPKFMEYGYPPAVTDFLFLKFQAAYREGLVPKEIWNGTAYGTLPGEGPGTPLGTGSKFAIGGGVLIALGVGAFLIFRKK
jgi:hypothetical protein